MSAKKSRKMSRYQPYPEYKDSGVEWLGEVPAHWDERKMTYLTVMTSGGTPNKEDPSYWNGNIPWVSPKDMKTRLIIDSTDHVSEKALQDTSIELIDPPVVLIVVRGMILAHTFPVAYTEVPVTINQDMKALRLTGKVDPDYFVHLLTGLGKYVLSLIEEAGHGTKRLRTDLWRAIKVYIPPLEEQQEIADRLNSHVNRIDALIKKKDRLIELLQEKRTALITHAVTKGLDPDVPMKDSGVEWLGEIPAHWTVVRLKHGAQEVLDCKNRTPDYVDDGEFGVVRTTNVRGGKFLTDELLFTTREDYKEWTKRGVPEPGDVLLTREAPAGEACLVPDDPPLCLGQRMMLARPGIDLSEANFIVYSVYGPQVQCFIAANSRGSTVSHLRVDEVKCLYFASPPSEEQEEIVANLRHKLGEIDQLIDKICEGVDHLKKYRTALISAAVTGKIDVRETIIGDAQDER